jgi:hypothetical protein
MSSCVPGCNRDRAGAYRQRGKYCSGYEVHLVGLFFWWQALWVV